MLKKLNITLLIVAILGALVIVGFKVYDAKVPAEQKVTRSDINYTPAQAQVIRPIDDDFSNEESDFDWGTDVTGDAIGLTNQMEGQLNDAMNQVNSLVNQ